MKDINLLPEEFEFGEKRKEVKRKKIPMNAIMITMLVIFFLAASFAAPYWYLKQRQIALQDLKNEIESSKFADVKEVNKKIDELKVKIKNKNEIVKYVDTLYYSMGDIITAVKNAMPPEGLVLDDMQYNGKTLQLSGKAIDNTVAMAFFSNVEAQGKFHGIENLSGPFGDSYGIYQFSFTFDVGTKKGGK